MVVTWTRRVAGQIVKYCILFQVADSGPILKVGFAGRFDVELWGGDGNERIKETLEG